MWGGINPVALDVPIICQVSIPPSRRLEAVVSVLKCLLSWPAQQRAWNR